MVYLFVGIDEYLKTSGAEGVIRALVPPEDRDFALETIDATCEKCEDVLAVLNRAGEALYTASFLGTGKVVWMREANFLPGTRGRATEAQDAKDAVARFFDELISAPLPEGHHLIISASSCPKTSAFYKWVAKTGKITECGGEVRSYQQTKVAQERLEMLLPEFGLQMSEPVRRAFVERVGADTRTLHSELEKLRTFLGTATQVSLDAIRAVTCSAVGAEPIDLSEAILVRSPQRLAQTVERLRGDKNSAFPAASVVLNTLNDLCALRDAIDKGWLSQGRWEIPPEELPSRLARLTGYRLSIHEAGAQRYTLNELRIARHLAVEMRFKMADSTSQEPWAIMEPVLLRMMARKTRTR